MTQKLVGRRRGGFTRFGGGLKLRPAVYQSLSLSDQTASCSSAPCRLTAELQYLHSASKLQEATNTTSCFDFKNKSGLRMNGLGWIAEYKKNHTLIFQRQSMARGKTSKGLIESYPPVSPLPLFPQADGRLHWPWFCLRFLPIKRKFSSPLLPMPVAYSVWSLGLGDVLF